MKNKKIIIAGGSGFIGQALAARWGKDNQVVILSRQSARSANNSYGHRLLTAEDGYNITYWHWDGKFVEKHWADELEGSDLVINLAGRSVNCRYTPHNKQEILDSRIDATQAIGQAIRETTVPPKLWINASSATIYRHAEDGPQDEYSEGGPGTLSEEPVSSRVTKQHFNDAFSILVCKLWEKTFLEQRTPFTRKIALRTAITLGSDGAIIPYLRLLKLGLGGRQGSGRQMYSWVHIEDVGRAMEWLLEQRELEGVYNLAAPGPVTNRFFMDTLRRVTGHRPGLPAPVWLLKIGAAFIGTEPELVLKSRWVVPTRLSEAGFTFRYERVEAALQAVIEQLPRKVYHLF
jgi:uncharacterized protein (TIGR01777 family)